MKLDKCEEQQSCRHSAVNSTATATATMHLPDRFMSRLHAYTSLLQTPGSRVPGPKSQVPGRRFLVVAGHRSQIQDPGSQVVAPVCPTARFPRSGSYRSRVAGPGSQVAGDPRWLTEAAAAAAPTSLHAPCHVTAINRLSSRRRRLR